MGRLGGRGRGSVGRFALRGELRCEALSGFGLGEQHRGEFAKFQLDLLTASRTLESHVGQITICERTRDSGASFPFHYRVMHTRSPLCLASLPANLFEDIRLGALRGKTPDWIVVNDWYVDSFGDLKSIEPSAYQFVRNRLDSEYKPVHRHGTYTI